MKLNNGGGMGLAPINRDVLRRAMAANRLREKTPRGGAIALGGEATVDGLAGLVPRTIQGVPVPAHADRRVVQAPTRPDRPLAARACGFTPRGIL